MIVLRSQLDKDFVSSFFLFPCQQRGKKAHMSRMSLGIKRKQRELMPKDRGALQKHALCVCVHVSACAHVCTVFRNDQREKCLKNRIEP